MNYIASLDVDMCCPACGGSAGPRLWESGDGTRSAFKCGSCELTFIWPRIEQDFSQVPEESYYGDWEMLDYYGGNFIVNDVIAAEGTKARYSRTDSANRPAVLDIGCGAGQILVHFRAQGWDVQGVDPWTAVTSIARRYFRLPIEQCKLEAANLVPDSKDVVLSIDVLQFIASPAAFLETCRSTLKPDGMLYLTVPNYGSAESVRAGWSWHYFHPYSYLNYFTPATIQALIERAGFYRVSVSTFGGPDGDGFLRVVARRAVHTVLKWENVSGEVDDAVLPPLDRANVDEAALSQVQKFWRENGYLVVPRLIPDELIEPYCALRETVSHDEGWHSPTPYMHESAIRDLCLFKPLADMLEHLLGEPMGLHLNLTGWVSTERDWHQDDYLNPPFVNGHYVAVWTALDDISEDSGPFEFVPGSHRWPIIRQDLVLKELGFENGDDKSWPWDSERLLTPFFEREIKERGAKVQKFLGKKGDVLIWHARLLHRGSLATRPGAERRSMIAHYSAITRRPDMPHVRQHEDGGYYFFIVERSRAGAKPDGSMLGRVAGQIKKKMGELG
jgi:2-polyprenyl-3-methyl-5-hydroxy-6-metoxy-1,4-benzoquinol methylase